MSVLDREREVRRRVMGVRPSLGVVNTNNSEKLPQERKRNLESNEEHSVKRL